MRTDRRGFLGSLGLGALMARLRGSAPTEGGALIPEELPEAHPWSDDELDITGDLDVRVKVRADCWPPYWRSGYVGRAVGPGARPGTVIVDLDPDGWTPHYTVMACYREDTFERGVPVVVDPTGNAVPVPSLA